MSQYTSYYLYQKYEKRGEQDWIPVYPNTYSIDGDGTMPLSAKTENDPACGYVPVEPTSANYLTFIARENGTFTFNGSNSTQIIQYTMDSGVTWNMLASSAQSPTVTTGNKIMWKGELTASDYNGMGTFTSTGQFDVEGNIMSLLYGDNFEDKTSLSGKSYIFANLFKGCSGVINAENLLLPATTLSNCCYLSMFRGCTALESTPDLPATTLENRCYDSMFSGCTSLTTAPELSATTLANMCYRLMFDGCTSLTTAPELPATTLATYCYSDMFARCTSLTTAPELPALTMKYDCYYGMFDGCTSLTTAPELPATWLAAGCYSNMFAHCTSLTTAPELPVTTLQNECYWTMFDGCTSLTTAPELPATTLKEGCYAAMFRGCTSLTTAPELPATALKELCYTGMFDGCTSLTYIKCLATNITATNCTSTWVNNVASSGTFVKNSIMGRWTTGRDGIPSGWTVQNA